MITALLVAAILAIPLFTSNALVFHTIKVKHRVRAMTLIWLAHVPLVYFLYPWLSAFNLDTLLSERTQLVLWSGALFTVGWYIYVNCYFMTAASITVSILVHYVRSGEQPLSIEQIQQMFPFLEVLDDRVNAMVTKGLLVESRVTGRRFFTPSVKALRYGQIFLRTKEFLQWGKGG